MIYEHKKNRLSYARKEPGGLEEITCYIYIYFRGGSRNTFGLEAQVLMLFTLGLHARTYIILYCSCLYLFF